MIYFRIHPIKLTRLINGLALLLLSLTILSRSTLAQARLGQSTDNHLQPVVDYFSAYQYKNEYYSIIRRHLLDGCISNCRWQVVA